MKKREEELFTTKNSKVTTSSWEFSHVKTYQGIFKTERTVMRWLL